MLEFRREGDDLDACMHKQAKVMLRLSTEEAEVSNVFTRAEMDRVIEFLMPYCYY